MYQDNILCICIIGKASIFLFNLVSSVTEHHRVCAAVYALFISVSEHYITIQVFGTLIYTIYTMQRSCISNTVIHLTITGSRQSFLVATQYI
jgi:hypothetical protein